MRRTDAQDGDKALAFRDDDTFDVIIVLPLCYELTGLLGFNYTNPGYGLSLVDTLWNAGSYRQPLEQAGNPMT